MGSSGLIRVVLVAVVVCAAVMVFTTVGYHHSAAATSPHALELRLAALEAEVRRLRRAGPREGLEPGLATAAASGEKLPQPAEVCGLKGADGKKIHCAQPGVTPISGHPAFIGPDAAPIGVDRESIPNPFGDDEPACDVPVHTISSWIEAHKGHMVMPDYPCIFKAEPKTGFQAMVDYPDLESLLKDFGNESVTTQPGYAQAGGHFHYAAPHSRVGNVWRLRDLARAWNTTHIGQYYSEFNCKTHFCQRFIRKVQIPEWFVADSRASTNFLVGGPGSGLPFHRHEQTFQMLVNGRKAWFLVPPGPVTDELAEVVGPYVFPPDSFDARIRGKPLGKRPLRCVQYPGEVIWLPPQWWHATMNMGVATVAYGQKPRYSSRANLKHEPASSIYTKVQEHFEKLQEGDVDWWYSIQGELSKAKHMPKTAETRFSHVLDKFQSAFDHSNPEDIQIMGDTVAFAYCFFSENLLTMSAKAHDGHPDTSAELRAKAWAANAKQLSPEIYRLQCLKQGRDLKDLG